MLKGDAGFACDVDKLDRKLAAGWAARRVRWDAGARTIVSVQKAAYASCRARADEYTEDVPPVHSAQS